MRAADIMTTNVVTVTPDSAVRDVAVRLLEHHISGLPVCDATGRLVGVITEADLIHRVAAQGARRPWWLGLFAVPGEDAAEFRRLHGLRVQDVMTREVVSVGEDAPAEEVARILEQRRIRRVPVVRDGLLVGIVSRADLLRVLVAAAPDAAVPVSVDDQALRERVVKAFSRQDWAHTAYLSVVVTDGVVHLWGFAYSDDEREALRVAAEEVPGVRQVVDHLSRLPNSVMFAT